MRPRSQTIGTLGRSPARQGRTPSMPPPVEPPPERGGRVQRWLHGAFVENLGLKFLSMVLAVTVFLLVNTDKDRELSARVGVSYTMPEDKVLVSDRLNDVEIRIRGPWRRLRQFDEHKVDQVNLDLRHVPNGEIAITSDMVHLPAGLAITSINPPTMRVAFEPRGDKLVEVLPTVTGHPQHGYVVAEIKAVPTTVKVRGPAGLLAALSAVRTREISLEGRTEGFVTESEAVPPDGIELASSQQVSVQVHIDEELVSRKLGEGIVVVVKGDGIDPAKWTVTPPQVEITLTGSLLAVEKARGAVTPVVRLTTTEKAREAPVTVEGLPPGVGVRIAPEHVKVAPIRN